MDRLSRIEVNINIALVVAQRGTCLRAKVGAVATMDNRVIATGYNGAPKGSPHCTEESCSAEDHCPNSIHAEANLIAYAAKKGVSLEGSTIYVTHSPCRKCGELITQAGIKEIVYLHPYRDSDWNMLIATGIQLTAVHPINLPHIEFLRIAR